MKTVTWLVVALVSGSSLATDQSPYAGEEHRSIKSLSAQEVVALRNGDGMGFAKAAELNHYPGPKHVLELADELDLTPSQLADTEALYEEMHVDAVAIGEELLAAEMSLEEEFQSGTIDSGSLESALLEIGRIRARLRYVHLETHLRQKRLLSPHQLDRYDELRGYQSTAHDHVGHSQSRDGQP